MPADPIGQQARQRGAERNSVRHPQQDGAHRGRMALARYDLGNQGERGRDDDCRGESAEDSQRDRDRDFERRRESDADAVDRKRQQRDQQQAAAIDPVRQIAEERGRDGIGERIARDLGGEARRR